MISTKILDLNPVVLVIYALLVLFVVLCQKKNSKHYSSGGSAALKELRQKTVDNSFCFSIVVVDMDKQTFQVSIRVNHPVITGYNLEIKAIDIREATVIALDYIAASMRPFVMELHVTYPKTFVSIN